MDTLLLAAGVSETPPAKTGLRDLQAEPLEVGQIIVANVNHERIAELLEADRVLLGKLIRKEEPSGT